MKRAISMLGAVAALAVGFLFAAPAAHAALPGAGTYGGVTCSYFANSTGDYPGNNHFLKCVSSTQKTNGVFGTVFGETAEVKDKLNNGNVTFYFFHSKADYVAYFTAAGQTPDTFPDSAHGFSKSGVTFPYSVIFEGLYHDDLDYTFNGTDLQNTTAHEIGHHMEYFWRNSLTVPASQGVSENGKKFDYLLQRDIYMLDHRKVSGVWQTRPPCGSNGALVNLKDPRWSLQTVCNGSTLRTGYDYGGKTNWEIIQLVNPYYFTQNESPGFWLETFAETFARVSGNVSSANPVTGTNWTAGSADAILGSEFGCIKSLVNGLRLYGTEPIYGSDCTMTLP